jgi:hypothetical protein
MLSETSTIPQNEKFNKKLSLLAELFIGSKEISRFYFEDEENIFMFNLAHYDEENIFMFNLAHYDEENYRIYDPEYESVTAKNLVDVWRYIKGDISLYETRKNK